MKLDLTHEELVVAFEAERHLDVALAVLHNSKHVFQPKNANKLDTFIMGYKATVDAADRRERKND